MSLIRGDALTIPLADDSVDLIVTSPPYFALRSYTDEGEHYAGQLGSEATPAAFIDALVGVTRECVRVLKPSGSLFVNLGDKYAGAGTWDNRGLRKPGDPESNGWGTSQGGGKTYGMKAKSLMGLPWRYALRCIDDLGLILRAEIIWSKPNGLPESVQDRVRRSHENWFHFTSEPRYYSAVDEIREPHTDDRPGRTRYDAGDGGRGDRGLPGYNNVNRSEWVEKPNGLGKLPGSVWVVPTEPLRVPDHLPQHFAAFPSPFPRRIILGWCPEGGRVLDPFVGTGTVPAVANALGRYGVGIDLSADYLRLARWRLNDPGLRAKALQVDKPASEVPGQMALL